ncbi:hypothetical protein [Streptomyces sp. NPDC054849]
MRPRDLIKAFRGDQAKAQDVIVAKDARIHELEDKLAATERDVIKLMRSGNSSAIDRIGYLEKELNRRARTIDQLRAGVVDDAQTAELRRQLHDLRAAHKGLHAQVEILTAANSGIPTLVEVAA